MHPSPDVLALLALGETAGTPADREHVSSCPECRSEVADLARAVAIGRGTSADRGGLVRPPERVWNAIRSEVRAAADGSESGPEVVASVMAPSEPATVQPSAPAGQSRGRRILALALAAAIALVVGIGLGFGLDRLGRPKESVLWTAQLQALPAFAGSSGEALVEQDAHGNKTLVVTLNASRPIDGSQEVWLIDRSVTKMQPLGHLTPSDNRFNIPADLDPRQYPVVDVSQEPPDGDPRHSGNSIVRGTLDA